MTIQQEVSSWLFPPNIKTSPAPTIGSSAPSTTKLPFPNQDGNPTIVAFLRHCGCPFAEKTFLSLRSTADANSHIDFVAVSHSDQASTDKWLAALGNSGSGNVRVIVDDGRERYAAWGLGASSIWHVLNPWSMWNVFKLGEEEGILN